MVPELFPHRVDSICWIYWKVENKTTKQLSNHVGRVGWDKQNAYFNLTSSNI